MEEMILVSDVVKEKSFIDFRVQGTWVMRISEDGISFNQEDMPGSTPDDFALSVMYILEQNFNVVFLDKKTDLIQRLDKLKRPATDEDAGASVSEAIRTLIDCVKFLILEKEIL